MQKRTVKREDDLSGKRRTDGRGRAGAAPFSGAAAFPRSERPVQEIRRSETVSIRGYCSDGRGIGRVEDGRVIFVPGVILGESVRVRFVDRGDRFLNYKLYAKRILLKSGRSGHPLRRIQYTSTSGL